MKIVIYKNVTPDEAEKSLNIKRKAGESRVDAMVRVSKENKGKSFPLKRVNS